MLKIRTRYQRMSAAVQIAENVRRTRPDDVALAVRMEAIIRLLAAPIEMVRAIEPDLEQMGVKPV